MNVSDSTRLVIPKGKLAVDASKLTRKRLAEDLAAGREVSVGSSGDVTGKEQEALKIQKGKLAVDASKLTRKRLAEDLAAGREVSVGSSGDVTGKEQEALKIQKGKLAVDASKLTRKRLAEDLAAGREVSVGSSGDVTGKEQEALKIQKGKLAAQWYQYDPQLLEDEKQGMNHFFPQFKLEVYDDPSSRYNGCLYWRGTLKPGILDGVTWDVMAMYTPNHPQAVMGSSVHVYLIEPDVQNVIQALGYRPYHLLRDEDGGDYLCTTRAGDISIGSVQTTAVQTLTWAVKWLMSLELVMTGDLDESLFNKHDGI